MMRPILPKLFAGCLFGCPVWAALYFPINKPALVAALAAYAALLWFRPNA
jgi:hypothetical protein